MGDWKTHLDNSALGKVRGVGITAIATAVDPDKIVYPVSQLYHVNKVEKYFNDQMVTVERVDKIPMKDQKEYRIAHNLPDVSASTLQGGLNALKDFNEWLALNKVHPSTLSHHLFYRQSEYLYFIMVVHSEIPHVMFTK